VAKVSASFLPAKNIFPAIMDRPGVGKLGEIKNKKADFSAFFYVLKILPF
jgi:hypothetical protein